MIEGGHYWVDFEFNNFPVDTSCSRWFNQISSSAGRNHSHLAMDSDHYSAVTAFTRTTPRPDRVRFLYRDDEDSLDEEFSYSLSVSCGPTSSERVRYSASITVRVVDDDKGFSDFWTPPPSGSPQRATRDLPSIVYNYGEIADADTGTTISRNTSLFTYTISGSDATDATRVREHLPRYFEVIYFAEDTFGMESYSKLLEGPNCEYESWVFDPDEDADGNWTISLYVRVAVPSPDSRACSRPAGTSRDQPDSSEFGTKHFGGEVYDARSGRTDRGAIGGDTTTSLRTKLKGTFGLL